MPLEHFDVEANWLCLAPASVTHHDGPVFWLSRPGALANFGHFVHHLLTQLDTFPSSWNSIQAVAEGAGIDHVRLPATASTQAWTLGVVDRAALEAALSR
jgi:hypothetical protein